MKGAAKVIMGAAVGALLVSSAGADQPKRLTAQSFYDRAIVVEMVLVDAIRSNKPRRLQTLYDALLDEYEVTWGRAAETDGRLCARLISALAVVAAAVHDDVEKRTAPSSMANSAWMNYRRDVAQCERQPGVVVFDRTLPEKLSEVF